MKHSRTVDLSEHPLLPVLLEAIRQLGGAMHVTEAMLDDLESRNPVLEMEFDAEDPTGTVDISLQLSEPAVEG